MQYAIAFFEGLVCFVSPCVLPLLPVYITQFTCCGESRSKVFFRALRFVLGFTVVFCILGAFTGSIGSILERNHHIFHIICGVLLILFGISMTGLFSVPFLNDCHCEHHHFKGPASAFLLGVIFSVSHAPCVGAFLGVTIVMASTGRDLLKSIFLLLIYSAGLGIPFVIFAMLAERLSAVLAKIYKYRKVMNISCGTLLILVGVLMIKGIFHNV